LHDELVPAEIKQNDNVVEINSITDEIPGDAAYNGAAQ
jgi:hypothetical protein